MHYYALNYGCLEVFDTQRERDAYCLAEDAEPVSMKTARRMMLDYISLYTPWEDICPDVAESMDKLISFWRWVRDI